MRKLAAVGVILVAGALLAWQGGRAEASGDQRVCDPRGVWLSPQFPEGVGGGPNLFTISGTPSSGTFILDVTHDTTLPFPFTSFHGEWQRKGHKLTYQSATFYYDAEGNVQVILKDFGPVTISDDCSTMVIESSSIPYVLYPDGEWRPPPPPTFDPDQPIKATITAFRLRDLGSGS